MQYPPDRALTSEDVRATVVEWRQARHAYPGWEIAPKRSRDTLGRVTRRWLDPIRTVLDEANPFVPRSSLSIANRSVGRSPSTGGPSDTEMWLAIACALITEARDDQDEDRFGFWTKRLLELGPLPSQWQARL